MIFGELKERIREILSKKVDSGLVEDLLESYEGVVSGYRCGRFGDVLVHGGRFVENVFRALWFLVTNEVMDKVRNVRELFNRLCSSIGKVGFSVLMLRIAYFGVYSLRSKRDVVHVNPVDPTFMDAVFVVTACNWIVAEFLRTLSAENVSELERLIHLLMVRDVPLIQRIGEEIVILGELGCKKEILLLLYHSLGGLSRREIGKILGKYYAQPTITNSLKSLLSDRLIFLTSDGKYVITDKGISFVERIYEEFLEKCNK